MVLVLVRRTVAGLAAYLLLASCSWMQADSGSYCYCKVKVEPDGDNGCEVTLDWEYANSASESQKEAEIPAL